MQDCWTRSLGAATLYPDRQPRVEARSLSSAAHDAMGSWYYGKLVHVLAWPRRPDSRLHDRPMNTTFESDALPPPDISYYLLYFGPSKAETSFGVCCSPPATPIQRGVVGNWDMIRSGIGARSRLGTGAKIDADQHSTPRNADTSRRPSPGDPLPWSWSWPITVYGS